jgi:hypothetical protein
MSPVCAQERTSANSRRDHQISASARAGVSTGVADLIRITFASYSEREANSFRHVNRTPAAAARARCLWADLIRRGSGTASAPCPYSECLGRGAFHRAFSCCRSFSFLCGAAGSKLSFVFEKHAIGNFFERRRLMQLRRPFHFWPHAHNRVVVFYQPGRVSGS